MTLSEKNLFPFFWLPSLILSFKIGRTGKGRWEGWRGGMRRKQRRHHCDLPLAERACGRRHVSPSSQGSSLSEDGERTLLLCGVSLGRSTESKPLSLPSPLLLLLPLHSEAPSFEIRYLASLSLSAIRRSYTVQRVQRKELTR